MSATDINERGVAWREALGGALHDAVHSGHPWSGCTDPDAVYDRWMPRFLLSLRTDGFDVTPLPETCEHGLLLGELCSACVGDPRYGI